MKISKKITIFILFLLSSFILGNIAACAQDSETKGEVEILRQKVNQLEKTVASQAELIAQQKQVLDKIIDTVPAVKLALTPPEPKTLVKSFTLDGVNLFQPKDFEPTLKKYRNKELSMSDLKKVTDEISAFYRKKGYVSSVAYLPAQEIADNNVEIKVVEGRVGDINVEKPKYAKASVIKNRFLIEKGQVLDSKKMETSLGRINRDEDRVVRAVLTPGQTAGTSDILLKVEKERRPYHFHSEVNNRGTSLTGKIRWGLGFTDTNLFGRDDALALKFMASQRTSDVYSFSGDYNLPVNRWDTRLGIYGAYAKADIGGQFAILSPEGKAAIFGIYASQPFFKKEFLDDQNASTMTLASNLTAGFDSLSVHNKILGQETSQDEIRSFKGGINLDEKDNMGRFGFSAETSVGIPDFLGSMGEHDVKASRIDAGGQFEKFNGSVSRVTYLPLNSLFLNTFRFQYTKNNLVNPEQMVIGGADTVRGFPENEYLADYGWIANTELRTPAWLIPSMLRVPFDSKHTRLIDAMQFVYFIDAGKGYLNKARVGEVSHKYLVGTGFGLRFDLYDRLHGRVDIGFPENTEPSDHAAYRVHFGFEYDW